LIQDSSKETSDTFLKLIILWRILKIKFKAILFDLDGTLLDTLKDLADSMNSVLSRKGIEIFPVDDYRYFAGKGAKYLVQCVMPKEHIDEKIVEEFFSAMKDEYSKRWAKNTKPYSGIPELLDELQRIGLPMAVLSNKSDEFTQIMVKSLLPQWKFKIIRGLINNVAPKPDPTSALMIANELQIPPREFLYLGDTDVDMQTANAAGMYAVGVLWGFRTAEELNANGAKSLIETPSQVLDLLKQ
jgi:phosphoglycolate phosphatase